jgi:hypothetical protein
MSERVVPQEEGEITFSLKCNCASFLSVKLLEGFLSIPWKDMKKFFSEKNLKWVRSINF